MIQCSSTHAICTSKQLHNHQFLIRFQSLFNSGSGGYINFETGLLRYTIFLATRNNYKCELFRASDLDKKSAFTCIKDLQAIANENVPYFVVPLTASKPILAKTSYEATHPQNCGISLQYCNTGLLIRIYQNAVINSHWRNKIAHIFVSSSLRKFK